MPIDGSGEIKLSDIYDEFTGTHSNQEIQLSDYHGDGNAPSSGEVQLAADFYGTSAGDWKGSRSFYFGGWFYNSSGSGRTSNHIQYKTMASDTNMGDFGDLTTITHDIKGSGSNGTRVMRGGGIGWNSVGGSESGVDSTVDYFTAASTTNASDAGDLNQAGSYGGNGASNGTLAFFNGNAQNLGQHIDYQNISTTSGATDAGDLTAVSWRHESSSGDSKYLVGGVGSLQTGQTTVDEHNFSTTANASDYGNVTAIGVGYSGSVSSTTRVVFGGGYINSSWTRGNQIHYLVVDSPADGTDAMDLIHGTAGAIGTSDGTRGEFMGGHAGSSNGWIQQEIQKVTIASLSGTATEIGHLTNEDNASAHTYGEAGSISQGGAQTAIMS